MSDLFKFY